MLNNLNQTLYFIAGPTCIGKSSLAIRLAKKINGVIINADSMQVYSNLNILTAKQLQPRKKYMELWIANVLSNQKTTAQY